MLIEFAAAVWTPGQVVSVHAFEYRIVFAVLGLSFIPRGQSEEVIVYEKGAHTFQTTVTPLGLCEGIQTS